MHPSLGSYARSMLFKYGLFLCFKLSHFAYTVLGVRERHTLLTSKRQRRRKTCYYSMAKVLASIISVNDRRDAHGCALFDFLVEVRGSDRGTSVVFRGSCYGLPWKSAGFHGKGCGFPLYMALPRQVPRLWPWHMPRFCPLLD